MPNYILYLIVGATMLWSTCKLQIPFTLDSFRKFAYKIKFYFIFRFSPRVLRMFQSDRQCGKMSKHNQNLRTGRRRLFIRNTMGKSTVLFARCLEAVLRFEAVLDQTDVRKNSKPLHEILYTHLVRGLDVFRMLPGRSLQLLCHCESNYTHIELLVRSSVDQ